MGSVEADFEYFAQEVTDVRKVLDGAVTRLVSGFQRLSQLPPSPEIRPPEVVPRY